MSQEQRVQQRRQAKEWGIRFAHKLIIKRRAVENQGKPANSVNGVTFSELMRQLRGES